MIDAAIGQAATRCQTGLAAADHDDIDVADICHGTHSFAQQPDQTTSTTTDVGLVTTSNTAERFWDWATTASISALVASASIS